MCEKSLRWLIRLSWLFLETSNRLPILNICPLIHAANMGLPLLSYTVKLDHWSIPIFLPYGWNIGIFLVLSFVAGFSFLHSWNSHLWENGIQIDFFSPVSVNCDKLGEAFWDPISDQKSKDRAFDFHQPMFTKNNKLTHAFEKSWFCIRL